MNDPEETEQEYSDRMHRENNPHYMDDPEFDEEHDPIFEDDYYDDDDYPEDECPACGGCGMYNGMECLECDGEGWL